MSVLDPVRCFHCGKPMPEGAGAYAIIRQGARLPVCCAGCEAAANLIHAQGLERFYDFRDARDSAAPSTEPDTGEPPGTRNWAVYDRQQAERRYTHRRADGLREVLIQIDGMHCAACAWLIENSVQRTAGVTDIQVNPTTGRATLIYDPSAASLGRLLRQVALLNYRPRPIPLGAADAQDTLERRRALMRLGVAGFGMMQIMTYAVSLYAGAMDGIAPNLAALLRFVSLLVATPVVLYSAQPFFAAAWRGLRAHTLGMDLPVALSIAAAYGWSVLSTLRGRGEVYFDSAVMFTFFLLLGRYVEMSLRHRSGLQHEAMAQLLPESVLRLNGGREERVTAEELSAGDRVRVLAGERIPADGVVIAGCTEVDEALLTGESQPRSRAIGDELIAGTVNLSGAIEMRVTRVGQDSTLAAVSRLLERAHASRPRIADIADRVAAGFVGGVLVLAAAVGLYWLHADAAQAFPRVLAVLVVTCPCALSLATPAAFAAGTTRLARSGLLVARGRALETLARSDLIVFDKTGTLTRGRPQITEVRVLDPSVSREQCLRIAAALERFSEHPIARAFESEPEASPSLATDVTVSVGRGIEGRVQGIGYRIGSADYVDEFALTGSPRPAADARDAQGAECASTVVSLGGQGGAIAEFRLSDALREDARATVERLRSQGLKPLIASGDRPEVVEDTARRLGGVETRSGLRASDKLALVHALQEQGHVVTMIGDGVNDAPVLAGADVSVAVGGGTLLARVSADMVLLGESLEPLCTGIDTARRTMTILKQNMTWAVLYNLVAVPMAAVGWLEPWMAAIGMSASSLLVTLNALRLLHGPRHAGDDQRGVAANRIAHA